MDFNLVEYNKKLEISRNIVLEYKEDYVKPDYFAKALVCTYFYYNGIKVNDIVDISGINKRTIYYMISRSKLRIPCMVTAKRYRGLFDTYLDKLIMSINNEP